MTKLLKSVNFLKSTHTAYRQTHSTWRCVRQWMNERTFLFAYGGTYELQLRKNRIWKEKKLALNANKWNVRNEQHSNQHVRAKSIETETETKENEWHTQNKTRKCKIKLANANYAFAKPTDL